MTNPEITAAKKLGARAAQRLDALPAATDHLAVADAWDALARHATTQASDCRRAAALHPALCAGRGSLSMAGCASIT